MNRRIACSICVAFTLSCAVFAQNGAPPGGQNRRGGGPGQQGMGGFLGRGVTGTVTEAAADNFTIKTMTGETYTIHFSANTRFMKQMPGTRGAGGAQGGGSWQRGQRNSSNGAQGDNQGRMAMGGGSPPQPIKATDIKVGDAIAAGGEIDVNAKSVGAIGIVQLDPERAAQMQQMEANYGKTWLMGKVTSINDVQVTLQGAIDNAPHTFVADENTSFRERNNPITLADIHTDDTLRVEGAVKDGVFTASAVTVMRAPGEQTRAPGNAAPPQ